MLMKLFQELVNESLTTPNRDQVLVSTRHQKVGSVASLGFLIPSSQSQIKKKDQRDWVTGPRSHSFQGHVSFDFLELSPQTEAVRPLINFYVQGVNTFLLACIIMS